MKKVTLIISSAFLFRLFLISCISTTAFDNASDYQDSTKIARGEASFNQNCSGCHNFKIDGIGPQLAGLTTEVSSSWVARFIKNPQRIISSGDQRAQQLVKKYKTVMPSFSSLNEDELNSIVSFLDIHKVRPAIVGNGNGKEVSNPIPAPVSVSNLVGGLKEIAQMPASIDSGKMPRTRITKLVLQPNDDKLFIVDLRGKLYKLVNNTPTVYMDMEELKAKFINKPGLGTGFGSFAFHPGFAKNGLLYTTHTEPAGSAKADFGFADSIKVTLQWVLTEWKADNPAAPTFSGKGRELFRVDMVSGIHGVQEITFNPLSKPGTPDYGLLYIGVGDGGCVETGYPFLAHSRQKVWGTILRIDPKGKNSANGQYGIPPGNPFAKNRDSKTLGEIYAYGFRNPHRITWTNAGKMLTCNIGHGNIESINLILPGHDYGWPIREGTFVVNPYADLNKVYPLPANDNIYKVTYPVAQYDHDEGQAISGGFEYTGSALPQLKGKYLFGDIPTGRLFYIDLADINQGKRAVIKEWKISINGAKTTLKEVCGNRVDLHFGRDFHGEMYLLTKADGRVYKLTSAVTK